MDKTDEKIIRFLKDDGRASYTEIADELGVSEGTVRNRVQRLQEENIIKGFTVEVDTGSEIEAFVTVQVTTDEDMEKIVNQISGDVEIYELAGDIDILLRIKGSSSEQINDKVDQIRAVEGVKSSKTYIVLSRHL